MSRFLNLLSPSPSFGGARGGLSWKGGLLLLLTLVFIGCRPHGVLSSRQMRSVLLDLHRTDAVLQAAGYNYGHDEDVAKYYQAVMDKHGITQAEFDSSLVWYTNHPQLFDKIYPPVVKQLEAERDAWQAQHDETQRLIGLELQDKWNREANPVKRKPIEEVFYESRYGLQVSYFLDATRPPLSQDSTGLFFAPDTTRTTVPFRQGVH